MNRQEVYDRVKKHLLTQNRKSMNESGDICVYRGPDNLRCAIGALISDEAYHTGLEGMIAHERSVENALNASGIMVETTEDRDLLSDLQSIHDIYEPFQWPDKLKDRAYSYGLNP